MSENRRRRIDQFILLYSARADGWRNMASVAREWAAGLVDADAVKEALTARLLWRFWLEGSVLLRGANASQLSARAGGPVHFLGVIRPYT
jgi:hypothetical protein